MTKWLGAAALMWTLAATAQPLVGDAERGQRVFAPCRTCHYPEKYVGHHNGPSLYGIFGRVVRSEHVHGKAGVPILIAADQERVLLHVPREHRPHDFAVARLWCHPRALRAECSLTIMRGPQLRRP